MGKSTVRGNYCLILEDLYQLRYDSDGPAIYKGDNKVMSLDTDRDAKEMLDLYRKYGSKPDYKYNQKKCKISYTWKTIKNAPNGTYHYFAYLPGQADVRFFAELEDAIESAKQSVGGLSGKNHYTITIKDGKIL